MCLSFSSGSLDYSISTYQACRKLTFYHSLINGHNALSPSPRCGCEYPGDRIGIDNFMSDNQTGMRPFVGNVDWCSDGHAQHEMLNPPQPEISWWTGPPL